MSGRRLRLFVALAAVAVSAVAVLGAGSSPAAPSKPKKEAATQEYYWFAVVIGHPFYKEGLAGWNAAAKSLGVKAHFAGPPDLNVQQQITAVEVAIAKPTTGGILIYPADHTAIAPVLKKARQAGIPVIIGNGEGPDKSLRDAFVGTENKALGAAAADLAAEVLKGKGKVGIVSQISLPIHKDRVQGFKDQVKAKYPNIKIIGLAPHDGTPTNETNAAAAFLQAHRDVNLIWTSDGGSGFVAGVIKKQGLAGKVLAVGTDRTAEQLDAIRAGTVYATIAQDTFAEEWVSLYYLYWLKNKLLSAVPDTTFTKAMIITKDNLPN